MIEVISHASLLVSLGAWAGTPGAPPAAASTKSTNSSTATTPPPAAKSAARAAPAAAAKTPLPPKIFIDKGACPLDCCVYEEWTVEKDTDLFDAIDGKKVVAKLKAGAKIKGMTGEVHIVPLKMKDKKGKEIYLLTPQGDELWKIWEDGKVVSDVEETWTGKPKPKMTWWLQAATATGVVGWTSKSENISDIDNCK